MPGLADIALKYLCVPTNSVDALRTFSVYGNHTNTLGQYLLDQAFVCTSKM